jgi:hypothetical protein
MAYGHAERNLALIRQLEAETRQLLASLNQPDAEQSAGSPAQADGPPSCSSDAWFTEISRFGCPRGPTTPKSKSAGPLSSRLARAVSNDG